MEDSSLHEKVENNYSCLTELENVSKESQSFLCLCKFLRQRNYINLPEFIYKDLIDLKSFNYNNKFCIRDSSDKTALNPEKTPCKFEVLINIISLLNFFNIYLIL